MIATGPKYYEADPKSPADLSVLRLSEQKLPPPAIRAWK
jgi:hypothetical protein